MRGKEGALLHWSPGRSASPTLAGLLESFFRQDLVAQRNTSPATVASYRDPLRLLVRYVAERTSRPPCKLEIADLDRKGSQLGSLSSMFEARLVPQCDALGDEVSSISEDGDDDRDDQRDLDRHFRQATLGIAEVGNGELHSRTE